MKKCSYEVVFTRVYVFCGKRIAKVGLIIAAIQFFRHVYGFIRGKRQCHLGSEHQ